MSYFNGNNKTLFHSTSAFVILLMICASPLMLQAAGGSDDDFTSQKSRDYQRAVSYIKKSDYSAAIPLLRKEVEKNPGNADAHNNLGYVLRKRSDLKNSAVHYKKALEINPKHLGALEYQGELFLTVGNLELAKANLEKLDKLCWLGCDEYDDLKASIEAYQQGRKVSRY
ncbi:MAG: tetratricopeptide repeat protein [Deltaproteobacteria bacterium]